MFGVDTDFIEPLDADSDGAQDGSSEADASETPDAEETDVIDPLDVSGDAPRPDSADRPSARPASDGGEQLTEPLSDDDLPRGSAR